MALVKNGELVTSSFVDASGAEAIPPTGPVIVSLDQWKTHRDDFQRGTPLGVRFTAISRRVIAADLPHFAVVALGSFSPRWPGALYARLCASATASRAALRRRRGPTEQLFLRRTGFGKFDIRARIR
jgi:uncharacterized protein (DUF934 family)